MILSARKSWESLDRLVEAGRQQSLTRRDVLRALALGLPLIAGGTLVSGCRDASSSPSSVTIFAVWQDSELASFQAMVAPFTLETGIQVEVKWTRNVIDALRQALLVKNPPDIAILSTPGAIPEFASQGALVALNTLLDPPQLEDYKQWKDFSFYQGIPYALCVKATNKGTIWYSPTQFQPLGLQTPSTWQDLIHLSNQIASSGRYPWSMGMNLMDRGIASNTTGWPAADWVAEIFLRLNGPDLYDKWVKHQIRWTHPSVKNAFQMFGQIVGGKNYINNAPQSILTTGFQAAVYPLYTTPPTAYLYYLADFTEEFITSQFPSLKPGTGFNFFPFPTIDTRFQGGLTVGADLAVALRKTDEVGELMRYLATAPAQEIWARRGGFLSPNRSVDLSVYNQDPVAKASALMLNNATPIKFGAGDLLPSTVRTAFWNGLLTYIEGGSLDGVLQGIEAAYSKLASSE